MPSTGGCSPAIIAFEPRGLCSSVLGPSSCSNGGYQLITNYLPVIFRSLSISRRRSLILFVCNAINLITSTSAGAAFIESVGRKPLILWGALAQGICFAFFAGGLGANQNNWSIVPIAFVFGYYIVFGLTWIAIPWMYPADLNTQQWRSRGAGIATATNWICNYVVALVTPAGIENITWRYSLVHAALNIAFVPTVYFFYEGTASLSLQEIDTLFETKHSDVSTAIMSTAAQPQDISEKEEASSEWVDAANLSERPKVTERGVA